ncbi:MAG: PAS-domain containing protein [Pseudomonadota bacterium]
MEDQRHTSRRMEVRKRSAQFVPLSVVFTLLLAADPALAQTEPSNRSVFMTVMEVIARETSRETFVILAMTLGMTAFAVACAIQLLRTRRRLAEQTSDLNGQLSDTREQLQRAQALLGTDDTAVVSWDSNGRAQMIGSLTPVATAGRDVPKLLDFSGWLVSADAQHIAEHLERLRNEGEGFTEIVSGMDEELYEFDGRARNGRAVLRVRKAQGGAVRFSTLEAENDRLSSTVEGFKNLLEPIEMPVWEVGEDGTVTWFNAAASETVVSDTSALSIEPVTIPVATVGDTPAGAKSENGGATVQATRKGSVKALTVSEVRVQTGRLGLAKPSSAAAVDEKARSRGLTNLATLNQLRTGVAMFNPEQRLIFCNVAFQEMFDLDTGWTLPGVAHAQILDVLHDAQTLPTVSDYRAWKARALEGYGQTDTLTDTWRLPDGRTLFVVNEPTADGGVTCIVEDQTERLTLETEFKSFVRVQRETLENMTEAVAVFKSDGKLDFSNPAFAQLWGLSDEILELRPHIQRFADMCNSLFSDETVWTKLRHAITDVSDLRKPQAGRMERKDQRIIEFSTVPLPQGATLVTFVDITDQMEKERVLRERNEALETAAQLKNDFIKHVSYELRTPLTSVIGFAEMVARPATGPLTTKQAEYVGDILSSSQSLLEIIDNILDLATIDAGVMELDLQDVDALGVIKEAAESIRERLQLNGIRLRITAPRALGAFNADPARIKQVLYNLLSNAIGFSSRGQVILLSCDRTATDIRFTVKDEGRGMTQEERTSAFDRFVTRPGGTSHRGAGLGLSIVDGFVRLHGGKVELESAEGQGTTVTCVFPLNQSGGQIIGHG